MKARTRVSEQQFRNGTWRPHLGIYDDTCGPHCDVHILHEPGRCDSCDRFPHYQKARELWGVAFTRVDVNDPVTPGAIIQDPAEVVRPLVNMNAWHGNTAKPPYAAIIADQIVNATDPEEIEQAIDDLRELKRELEAG